MTLTRILAWAGFLVGLAMLGLQFAITIPARIEVGDTFLLATVYFFSFFTILTNIVVLLIHLVTIRRIRLLEWFDHQATRVMAAATIFLVMATYHFLLAPIWDPQGLFKIADIGLHYVTPILYLAMWMSWPRRQRLPWSSALFMVIPPALYLVYAMVRGTLTGQYPYFFIDPAQQGYALVAINIVVLLIVLLALSGLALAFDRSRSRQH